MKMRPCDYDSAYEYAPSLVLDLAENSLHHEHHLGEVIRYKAAYHSQYYREGIRFVRKGSLCVKKNSEL